MGFWRQNGRFYYTTDLPLAISGSQDAAPLRDAVALDITDVVTDRRRLAWTLAGSTLLVSLLASGIGILMARNRLVHSAITSLLDVMQTFPTFVYLAPFALFFGIGASSAVMLTLVYAMPPIIRITAHGILEVSPQVLEATDSAGQTSWQRLVKVELPMARRTIVVGLNQTTLAALSMATLAAFVDGPGLGQPVLDALKILDVGGGFVPGALIVATFAFLNGLYFAGIAATFAMALGTGITVATLAALAVWAKDLAIGVGGAAERTAIIHRVIEIGGAAFVLILGLTLLSAALYG